MSKNISIKERNQNLKYKTTVLKTALQGGGYCEWVPESEVETEVLRAYSNGHYTPDKYAFSEAVVNVPAIFVQGLYDGLNTLFSLDIDGIIINEILPIDFPDIKTTPFIIEDLHIVTVDPTSGDRFDIDLPDEFDLMNSLLSPFSSDWLIADFDDYTQIISHPDGIDATPFVDPVDTSGARIPIADVNLDNDYIIGVDDLGNFHVASINTEGFVSTTTLGFTPTTFAFDANGMMDGFDANGNMMTAILEDGKVTQEYKTLPSSIEIIVNPTKTIYASGETIDITGIVVVAKNADGTTWTSVQYPNGHIPLQELILPITTASLYSDGTKIEDSRLHIGPFTDILRIGSQRFDVYANPPGGHTHWECIVQEGSVGVFFSKVLGGYGTIVASKTEDAIALRRYGTQNYGERQEYSPSYASQSYTYDGKTAYYSHIMEIIVDPYREEGDFLDVEPSISENQTTRRNVAKGVAWGLLYGGRYTPIPVQWQIGDLTLEDSFNITVSE